MFEDVWDYFGELNWTAVVVAVVADGLVWWMFFHDRAALVSVPLWAGVSAVVVGLPLFYLIAKAMLER